MQSARRPWPRPGAACALSQAVQRTRKLHAIPNESNTPLLTNGPAATIGEVPSVDLPRPRERVQRAKDLDHVRLRKQVLDFLYTRRGHVEAA